jgi:hypothetical protein
MIELFLNDRIKWNYLLGEWSMEKVTVHYTIRLKNMIKKVKLLL